jgi:glycine cleavage system H protein
MNFPKNLKYSESDEWFNPEDGNAGLSDYAQDQLSDIVFVEILVGEGDSLTASDPIASVESVKAAAEIYSPVSGKVAAVNDALSDTPEVLNSDPYGAGWMIKIEAGDASGLMDAAAYQKHCEEREH